MKKPILALALFSIFIFQAFAESPKANNCEMDSRNIVDAQQILERIEKGESFTYQNQFIIGDLNIQQLNLSRDANYRCLVESAITFKNCEFQNNVYFNYAIFNKSLNFAETTFSGEVNFGGSELNDISFWKSEFHKAASFDGAEFLNGTDFRHAIFWETASFVNFVNQLPSYYIGAIFYNDAYFGYSKFNNDVSFEDAEFRKSAIFHDAVFEKDAQFQSSKFLEPSDFANCIFKGDVKFINVQFEKPVDFGNATFMGDTSFHMTQFNSPADFSNANFSEESNFQDAMFNKVVKFSNATFNGNISFAGAYFERDARFEMAQFSSNLNLTEATFYELMLPWEAIKGRIGEGKATHLALINNYKNIGWISDRNSCYYQYREMRRNAAQWNKVKLLDSISWAYWGYGVRPYNAVFWIAVIVISFSALYRYLVRSKRAAIKSSSEDASSTDSLSLFQFLRFSALTLASKSPDNIQIEGSWIRQIIWFERVVGGFFFVMFFKFLTDEILSFFKPPT